MFTGLVQAVGEVRSLSSTADGARLVIDPGGWSYRAQPGESVAVNGCCLTHAPGAKSAGLLCFDVVKQTLERTTLGLLREDDGVNLESSVTASTPLGGHFVQGHIDGVGIVKRIVATGEHLLVIEIEHELMGYVVPRGSVTVEGVSLTIAEVDVASRSFAVALIPTTLRNTTLGRLDPGRRVNVETDIMARTVVHYLRNFSGPRP